MNNSEQDSCMEIVDQYLYANEIKQYVDSQEMLDEISHLYYKNTYYYDMDDEYALKDAVSSVFMKHMIFPNNYTVWTA